MLLKYFLRIYVIKIFSKLINKESGNRIGKFNITIHKASFWTITYLNLNCQTFKLFLLNPYLANVENRVSF
jgi:hypothetical protein